MTIDNIVNGFRATGFFPLNKDTVPLQVYAPSLPTLRVNEATQNNGDGRMKVFNY